jgi:hypothetical protein
MEVKVLFGRHIWELAQQADGLGKRVHELRAPLQFSLRPIESYVEVLEEFAQTAATAQKIHGFYDVILPGLAARYRNYLERTDQLLDEPTVRVIERILNDSQRMIRESHALRDELPQLRLTDKNWPARLAKLEASEPNIVMHRSSTAVA